MNFSTLKSLTIPEGVVTQIADASGRVLWSAVAPFVGSFFLRPSSDISVGHDIWVSSAQVTDGSVPAYQCINEEEADGSATYIQVKDSGSDDGSTTGVSEFGLSGTLPDGKIVITDCAVTIVVPGGFILSGTCTQNISLFANGVEIANSGDVDTSTATTYAIPLTAAIDRLNSYIDETGALPTMSIKVTSTADYTTIKTATALQNNITQLYVELVCG